MFTLLPIIIYNSVCLAVVLPCKKTEVSGYLCHCEVSRRAAYCKRDYLCMVTIYTSYAVDLKVYKYPCVFGSKNLNLREINPTTAYLIPTRII